MTGPRAASAPTAVAVGTVLLVGLLRRWLPEALSFSEAASTLEVALVVLAPFVVAFVLVPALTTFIGVHRTLLWTAIALAVGRVALQPLDVAIDPDVRLAVTLLAVAAAAAWLGAVAAGGAERRSAAIGLVAGIGLDVVLHTALDTVDAVWREDPSGWIVTGVLVAVFLLASWLAHRPATPEPPTALAWPWLAAGPFIALHLLVATSPHLTAVGGLDARVALGVLVATHLVAIVVTASLVTAPSRGLVAAASGLLLLGLAATLADRMPFETPTVHALGTATVIIAAAICATALGSPHAGRSPARNAAATLVGLAVAVGLVLAHDGHLVEVATGRAVWGAAIVVAGLGLVALRRTTELAAAPIAGHPALVLGVLLLVVGGAGALDQELQTRSAPPAGTAGTHLLVIHQHVGPVGGRGLVHDLTASVAGRSPDVVTLTDVPRGALTAGGVDPVALVRRQLGLAPLIARTDRSLRGDVILAHGPTTETRLEPLADDGVVLVAVLDTAADEVAVLAAHLPADADEVVRERQIRRISAIAGDLERMRLPALLTGTFWRAPDAPELEPLRDRMRSLSGQRPLEPTWPAHSPRVVMDHVYVSDGLVAADLAVGPPSVGSHLPVAVQVRIATEP